MNIRSGALIAMTAAAGLLLAACGGDDTDPAAFPSVDASASTAPVADPTPSAEPTPSEAPEAPTDLETPYDPAGWNPVMYPEDPDGPKEIVDTIDLKVGDPVFLPMVPNMMQQKGWTGDASDVKGVGTPCLRSGPDQKSSNDQLDQAFFNSPYAQGLVYYADCPATVTFTILPPEDENNPDAERLPLHTYTITITK